MTSKIEWTEDTWNPIVGCSVVSPGCTNCYAMRMAGRLEAMSIAHEGKHGGDPGPLVHYRGTTEETRAGDVWTGKLAMASEKTLSAPLRRKKPTTYFVNSMGDLFHEDVPDEWIDQVFAVMALCPQHRFQVLTKRAERMRDYLTAPDLFDRIWTLECEHHEAEMIPSALPLANVWMGISAEDQRRANDRIPILLETPAAIRFVSLEPLLGPINLTNISYSPWARCALTGGLWNPKTSQSKPPTSVTGIKLDWVIVGGESGPGARPFDVRWAHKIVGQCQDANVPVFVKQLGAHVIQDGERRIKRDKKGGDMSEWPHDIRIRDMPEAA